MHSARGFTLVRSAGFTLVSKACQGFTLVELLIVITIIGILTTVTYVNFKNFSQDQQVNKAIGEIQTYLRLAQSNASSSTLCGSSGGVAWIASFRADKSNIDIFCGVSTTPYQTLSLSNVQIKSITSPKCGVTPLSLPLTVTYFALSATPTISDSSGGSNSVCLSASQTFTISLTNIKNNVDKSFNISAGGAIDVQ